MCRVRKPSSNTCILISFSRMLPWNDVWETRCNQFVYAVMRPYQIVNFQTPFLLIRGLVGCVSTCCVPCEKKPNTCRIPRTIYSPSACLASLQSVAVAFCLKHLKREKLALGVNEVLMNHIFLERFIVRRDKEAPGSVLNQCHCV